MKNQQTLRIINQLTRMFRQGGKTRWLAIAMALGFVGLVLFRPDLIGGSRSVERPSNEFALPPSSSSDLATSVQPPPAQTPPSGAPNSSRSVQKSKLTEIKRDVFQSPAGLVYTRGSQEGHRIKHVLAHGKDSPTRPGQHGVFQPGDQDTIIALLDEAYSKFKQGDRAVRKQQEERRTVLTVDLGRTIGYVGGESGNRRGKPSAKHLRMVLEDERVITAFPVVP